MILLIDAGNTRIKWRLIEGNETVVEASDLLDSPRVFDALHDYAAEIREVAVSTVGSEQSRLELGRALGRLTGAEVRFYWAEKTWSELTNSYVDVGKMGADRWHAMVGAWSIGQGGCAVVDAGSAVTVDYVDHSGKHLGGYILPGLQMMRRSLKLEAARIGFDYDDQLNTSPGSSTGECANHGLAWLTAGLIEQIHRDVERYKLECIFVTGGDAWRFVSLGLQADHRPGLVFDGLLLMQQEGAE